jgi:hypothetical protein
VSISYESENEDYLANGLEIVIGAYVELMESYFIAHANYESLIFGLFVTGGLYRRYRCYRCYRIRHQHDC